MQRAAKSGLRRLVPVVALALVTAGCSFEKLAADQFVPVLRKTSRSFNRSRVYRAARESAPALLAQLEGIRAASPENEDLLLLTAELKAGFAFGFIEQEWRRAERDYREDDAAELKTWTNVLYDGAAAAARQVLEQRSEGLPAKLDSLPADKVEAALAAELDKDDAPAVFWWAFARGAAIQVNLDRGADVTKDVPRVKALMGWCLQQDERYYNGGAHLFFALLNTALGKSIGGRPELAEEHLKAVERITGGRMLMAKVFRCQFVLPQLQTPSGNPTREEREAAQRKAWDEYIKTLEEVMAAPDDLWPEQALLNVLAKRRAKDLYYRADDVLFPPPGVEIPSRDDE